MFTDLSGDQVRIQANATQTFEAWRESDRDFRHSYRGRMNWSSIKGQRYLYRIEGNVRQSLGPHSPETEQIKADYTAQRSRMRDRRARLARKLSELAPINRAYRIGRVPETAAKVLAALDTAGLLGEQLLVVGTHSLYAYEAAAGVHFDSGIIATDDVDLLWDARRHLKLTALDVSTNGVLGILRRVDKSFAKTGQGYQAANSDGYLVDLIRPLEANEVMTKLRGLGGDLDLEAAAIMGLQWLINAPRFEQVAISERGMPVRVCCIDPRAFALHKLWLANDAPNRAPAKKRRDRKQALAAAGIAASHLDLRFNAKDLTALPIRLTQHAQQLAADAARAAEGEDEA